MNAGASDATSQHARGSVLIGMDVQAPSGKAIGAVQDMVVERDGRISYVMVTDRDATQSVVAIPWSSFQSMMRDGRVVMEESRLAKAPRFARSQWPDLGEGKWSADVDRYWKMRTATR